MRLNEIKCRLADKRESKQCHFLFISQDCKFKTEAAQITFIVLQSLYINKCLFSFYLHFKINLVKTSEKKLLLKVLFWRQAFKSQISETSI